MSTRDVIAETISAHTTMTVAPSWPPTMRCRCGWKIQTEGWEGRAAAHAEHLAGQIGDALAQRHAVVKLPQPDMEGEHVWSETEGHPVANWFADGLEEWVMSCCGEIDVNGLPPKMTAAYARDLAARLLAAARHADEDES